MSHCTPHTTCTWGDPAACSGCGIQGRLACRWDKKILAGFHGIAWPALATAVFGMVLVGLATGVWWTLIGYVAYFFLMFGVLEIRFLCSHCPYYAEEGRVLHCLANHGSYKLWRYHPEPLNRLEKAMMYVLLATVFFVFPLAIHGYGIWALAASYAETGLVALMGMIGVAAATLIFGVAFVITLKTFFCPKCVNFSCPLNTVPKPVVDAYLKKNDVMREAWERSGWQVE